MCNVTADVAEVTFSTLPNKKTRTSCEKTDYLLNLIFEGKVVMSEKQLGSFSITASLVNSVSF